METRDPNPYVPEGMGFISCKEYERGIKMGIRMVMERGLGPAVRFTMVTWPSAVPEWRVQDFHRGIADCLSQFVQLLEASDSESFEL